MECEECVVCAKYVECGVWVVLHTVVCIYTWQLKVCRSQQTCMNSAKKCAVPGGSNDSKKGKEESFIQIIQQPLKKKCIIAKRAVKCVTIRYESSTFINRI